MSAENDYLLEELIKSIKSSQEYNQYMNLLDDLKKHPDLYNRIAEFRKRSMQLQMTDNVDFLEENNKLQNEFSDLQANGLANEFLTIEHQYCMMIKEIQEKLLDSVDIDTGFLE